MVPFPAKLPEEAAAERLGSSRSALNWALLMKN